LSFPKPAPAQIIRYSYLWRRDAERGVEEGSKDRPCAVVMTVQDDDGEDVVTVLPVTHAPPRDPADALEIPPETKRRLGLDDERSWIVVTECNRFFWPGPDLRMKEPGNAASVLHGSLPGAFFERVRLAFLAKVRAARAANIVKRTE
jgi:hypothetical protein